MAYEHGSNALREHSLNSNRPDRALVVKCTFDRWNKRITFSSARNCTYNVLRQKVEQCFSLSASSYIIAYKDDDGEITDITNETDLTEAIQYFQAGVDDLPISSAASILSGRSFGSRKITLRVHITVDYDGPSLSDTSSLVSLEEYAHRNGSDASLSMPSANPEVDDDSVTVSSRDFNGSRRATTPPMRQTKEPSIGSWDRVSSGVSESDIQSSAVDQGSPRGSVAPGEDYIHVSAETRYPEDPSAVFERLKLEEMSQGNLSGLPYDRDLSQNERGTRWLRDQNLRMKTMLGTIPEPSESDDQSVDVQPEADPNPIAGDLALQQDPRGKWYYSYTGVPSARSQTHDSGYEDAPSVSQDISLETQDGVVDSRPTSMELTFLTTHNVANLENQASRRPGTHPSTSRPGPHSFASDPLPVRYSSIHPSIPPEVLQFVTYSSPPTEITDCSACGMLLDSFRYVCSTCGEKKPCVREARDDDDDDDALSVKGKGKQQMPSTHSAEDPFHDAFIYPPSPHHLISSTSSFVSASSQTILSNGSERSHPNSHYRKPLPLLPTSPTLLAVPEVVENGYELCSGCIESAGVIHALEAGIAPGTSPGTSSPSSPEEERAMSRWRRTAPKHKGRFRHAYMEKVWGAGGWTDVEQDDSNICKCSTCGTTITSMRYKCASCQKFDLCRACYSQVHELHPSHAFLVVPDRPTRSRSEPDLAHLPTTDGLGEQSLTHPGVKCAHCMLDIVGARFHCAICSSIDICSNCESAGLPGNLDSADGGHVSTHIMIKIPYPLETTEVQTASRRARHLWTDRDAPSLQRRSRSNSLVSSYARTVVGAKSTSSRSEHPGSSHTANSDEQTMLRSHQIPCNACLKTIVGVRFQCASCPSLPTSYNLCGSCEARSYSLHDPMHVFFKLGRPVDRPIESPFPLLPRLYRMPAGPHGGNPNPMDPRAYLQQLVHSAAICDRCMENIRGEWFRCAYCVKDLCDDCEALDTHNPNHLFVVFKSQMNMQSFKHLIDLENPERTPPILPYPVYRS